MTAAKIIAACLLVAVLAGCDQLGIETPDKVAARQEAEGKAVGGACRHSGRALEECYEMNRRSSKAAIYAGWRDMDGYMRENNIAAVKPSQSEDETAPKALSKSETKSVEGERKAAAEVVSRPAGEKPADNARTDSAIKAPTKTS